MGERLKGIPGFSIDEAAAAAGSDPEMLRMENLDTDIPPPPAAVEATRAAVGTDEANSWLPFTGMSELKLEIARMIVRRGAGRSSCRPTGRVLTYAPTPIQGGSPMQGRLRIVGLVGVVVVFLAIGVAPVTAAPPALDISPSPGHFGKQPVGTTTVQTFTITNTSSEPVTISSATIIPASAFDFANLSCLGTTLAPGGSCTIDVSFMPTATDWYRANFCVNSATGAVACTKLSGRGI